MKWNESPEVQEAIRKYLVNQKDDLGNLLNTLTEFNDGSHAFQFLKVWGMFVYRYSANLEKYVETEAWDLTVAEISNDPTVQGMVSKVMHNQLNKGLGI